MTQNVWELPPWENLGVFLIPEMPGDASHLKRNALVVFVQVHSVHTYDIDEF